MEVKIPYDTGIYHGYHVLLFLYSRIDLFFSILDVINVKQSIYLRYNSSSHTLHTSAELFFYYLLYVFKLRFPHKNDVRFVFTSSFLGELMSYLRCVCLFAYICYQHILCCHLFLLLSFDFPLRYPVTFKDAHEESAVLVL
jgi:hypothetical protein